MENYKKNVKIEELKKLQALPLDMKIDISEARILEFVHKMGGSNKVYIAFSGGKDSTVLLHLIRSLFPDVEAVFSDTGLEFPELKDFVKSFDNVTIIRPDIDFRTNIIKNGYPLISKRVADAVYYGRKNPNNIRAKNLRGEAFGKETKSKFGMAKYGYLLDAPFELNNKCCDEFKKKPMKKFRKKSGKSAFVGTLAEESLLREAQWVRHGCNMFTKGKEQGYPLSVWTEKDIWDYIKRFNLEVAEPYKMGYKRTGCVFCGFGANLEKTPNRFQMLRKTHPNLYEYMMKPKEQGGLGFKEPLNFIGVSLDSFDEQSTIFDFIGEKNEND